MALDTVERGEAPGQHAVGFRGTAERMATFFQPVALSQWCLLREALLWVAVQRLPILTTDHEGVDIRESPESGAGYEIEVDDSFLYPDECRRAGIPEDPNYRAFVEERETLSVSYYDEQLRKYSGDQSFREHLEEAREEAREFENDFAAWEPRYLEAIEYPASQLFVALKGGRLIGRGRPLPMLDADEARKFGRENDLFEIEFAQIPSNFWSLQGINFEASAARNGTSHYCHISVPTDQLLQIFPGPRESVSNVEGVGDALVVVEATKKAVVKAPRGRPSYPWEPFHLEVAALLRSNGLPEKKEAAIEYFQAWFFKNLNIRPSRAAIGEKLTPYYDKFIRPSRQKI